MDRMAPKHRYLAALERRSRAVAQWLRSGQIADYQAKKRAEFWVHAWGAFIDPWLGAALVREREQMAREASVCRG